MFIYLFSCCVIVMLGNGKRLGVVKHPGSKKSTSLTVAAEPHGAGAGVVVATTAANAKIAEAHGDGGGEVWW
jgi:hypothetical protein